MTIILLLSMKGNGECVCENHGYTEVQCLQKGCCKFDHSVGKVPFILKKKSSENHYLNLASAFLMLERVPA